MTLDERIAFIRGEISRYDPSPFREAETWKNPEVKDVILKIRAKYIEDMKRELNSLLATSPESRS